MNAAPTLTPYTDSDWEAFNGTEEPKDSPPLITYDVYLKKEDDSLVGCCAIADGYGLSVHSENMEDSYNLECSFGIALILYDELFKEGTVSVARLLKLEFISLN